MKTPIDWFYDKIKSHFEHDGDLLETLTFTYAIAKDKERDMLIDFLLHLNERGLINDYDFDYEKEAKKFLKSSVCTCRNAELEKDSLVPVYCHNCNAYVQTDL